MASKTTEFKKKNNNRTVGTIIGSVIILFIVVVSFVVAPALGDLGQSSAADIELGSYGNEKITFSFINETPFRQQLASLSNNSTDSMDPRLAQVAYQRAVIAAAAVEEYTANGYSITKEQLDDAVLASGYYNDDVSGKFSTTLFKNTPESTKQAHRESIERDMLVQNWMVHTLLQQRRSSKYLEFISAMSDDKRNFEYVTFSFSDYPDELIRDYANNDPEKFIELSLSRITVESMSKANEIIEKIESNESTFEELAATYSTDNFRTDGGKMSSKTYAYEFESIFGLSDYSDLLKMKVGDSPYIVEQDDSVILLVLNEEITEPDFSDLTSVRNYMLSNERGIIEDYFYGIINSSKDNNLASFGKEIKETGAFAINYGGETIISTSVDIVAKDSIFTSATSNDNFFNTLFSLEDDVISEPIVLGNTISVFKLKEIISDETMTDDYVLYSKDNELFNYKTLVSEDLIFQSDKYVDNFYTGYFEILRINQGL